MIIVSRSYLPTWMMWNFGNSIFPMASLLPWIDGGCKHICITLALPKWSPVSTTLTILRLGNVNMLLANPQQPMVLPLYNKLNQMRSGKLEGCQIRNELQWYLASKRQLLVLGIVVLRATALLHVIYAAYDDRYSWKLWDTWVLQKFSL